MSSTQKTAKLVRPAQIVTGEEFHFRLAETLIAGSHTGARAWIYYLDATLYDGWGGLVQTASLARVIDIRKVGYAGGENLYGKARWVRIEKGYVGEILDLQC